MFDGLLPTADAAKRAGLTKSTFCSYVCNGIAPPPRMKIGSLALYDKEDIDWWMAHHNGRPGNRNSVKAERRR